MMFHMVIDVNRATKLLAIQPARVVRVLVKAVLLVCIPACSAIERILKNNGNGVKYAKGHNQ